MITGSVGIDALRLADQRQAVHAGHVQVGDQQVVVRVGLAQQTERRRRRRPRSRRRILAFKHPRQQLSNALLIVDEQDSTAGGAGAFDVGVSLPLEPLVDVALAEAPLSAHPHGGNSAGLDQSIHRSQVDVEVFENLLGRQEDFVGGEIEGHWFLVLALSVIVHRRLRARRSKPQRLKDLECKCRLPACPRRGGLTAV